VDRNGIQTRIYGSESNLLIGRVVKLVNSQGSEISGKVG
jgi:hypothetical protein